jgi:hypothetical protein
VGGRPAGWPACPLECEQEETLLTFAARLITRSELAVKTLMLNVERTVRTQPGFVK